MPLRVYRVCRARYARLDGDGARRVGGRWNSPGRTVVYMAESTALAVLENLVHMSRQDFPSGYVCVAAALSRWASDRDGRRFAVAVRSATLQCPGTRRLVDRPPGNRRPQRRVRDRSWRTPLSAEPRTSGFWEDRRGAARPVPFRSTIVCRIGAAGSLKPSRSRAGIHRSGPGAGERTTPALRYQIPLRHTCMTMPGSGETGKSASWRSMQFCGKIIDNTKTVRCESG